MDILYAVSEEEMYQVDTVDVECSIPFVVSFDENLSDVEDFLKIFGKSLNKKNKEYKKLQEALNLTNKEMIATIPAKKRKEYVQSISESLRNVLCVNRDLEYIEIYLQGKRFLRSLKKPLIDLKKTATLANGINHDHIALKVKELGTSKKKTRYSMSGTVTGRLTVTSGPNILTLPSQARSCIKSSYEKGKILQIDLVSAEPHLALLMSEKQIPDDIYEHLSQNVLNSQVSRKISKLVTLSALYGQSASNLKKSLPDSINPHQVIDKTKTYFETERLRTMLKSQLINDRFRNVLGRPVLIDHERKDLMISYFLQSSIAELSLVLFSKFINECKSAIPYYVIHDALIFDANENVSNILLQQEKIYIEYGGWKFQAKITPVGNI
jgi:hypothetical protein